MRTVRHLIAHDLRNHAPLLAVWVAIVLAHPLLAALPWSDDGAALGWVLATTLVAARVVLVVVLIAALVQPDGPTDERTFWRTRPIRPAAVAASKLTVAVAVFVVVPLGVVLAVAAWLGVPRSYWPAAALGVGLGETPLVLLSVVAATCTRRTSTAVLASAALLLLLAALELVLINSVLHVQPWLRLAAPSTSLTTMAAWLALCLLAMAVAGWSGRRTRIVSWGAGMAAVVGLFLLWLVPTARGVARETTRVQPPPTVSRLELRRDRDNTVWLAAVVSHPFGAAAPFALTHVSIRVGDHQQRLSEVMSWRPSRVPSERVLYLLHLSTSGVQTSQGQLVRISGHVVSDLTSAVVEAQTPLAAGSRFAGEHVSGTIDEIHQPTDDAPALADVTILRTGGLFIEPTRWIATIRDRSTGSSHQLGAVPREAERLAGLLRLPVLVHPFEVQRFSLQLQPRHFATIDPHMSTIAFARPRRHTLVIPIEAALPMPTTIEEGEQR